MEVCYEVFGRFRQTRGRGKDRKRMESRRDFMKFCSAIAAVMGMDVICQHNRPGNDVTQTPVRRLVAQRGVHRMFRIHFAGSSPIHRRPDSRHDQSDYHETTMAAAGHKAEEVPHQAVSSPNGFICVVEGAIPTKDNGIYGSYWPDHARHLYGNPAQGQGRYRLRYLRHFGGVQAAKPNPTGSKWHQRCIQGTWRQGRKHCRLPAEPHEPCGRNRPSAHAQAENPHRLTTSSARSCSLEKPYTNSVSVCPITKQANSLLLRFRRSTQGLVPCKARLQGPG